MADVVFKMAPMIDIVLLTMIVFICTRESPEAYLPDYRFDLRLPDPGAIRRVTSVDDVNVDRVIVRVRDDGALWVNDAPRTEDELTDMLTRLVAIAPRQAVVVAGEPEAQHMCVVRVLNACYRAGISDISFSFATLPEE